MSKIDYKNRSILMSVGLSDDGQTDVEMYYDRYDKVTYIKDLKTNRWFEYISIIKQKIII